MGKKFTITESDRAHIIELYGIKNVIDEQIPDSRFGTPEDNSTLKKTFTNHGKTDQHIVNTILSIGSAFIPLVGPFISAGIGLYDANLYYNEGDKKTASLVAVLSLLPGVGTLVSKIPGIKQLGPKGMGELGKKLLTKAPLSKIEQLVLSGLNKNPQLLVNEVDNVVKSMAKKALTVGKIGVSLKQILKVSATVGVCAGSVSCSKEDAPTPKITTSSPNSCTPEIQRDIMNKFLGTEISNYKTHPSGILYHVIHVGGTKITTTTANRDAPNLIFNGYYLTTNTTVTSGVKAKLFDTFNVWGGVTIGGHLLPGYPTAQNLIVNLIGLGGNVKMLIPCYLDNNGTNHSGLSIPEPNAPLYYDIKI